MNRWRCHGLVLALACLTLGQRTAAQVDVSASKPPVAKKAPKTTTIHGDTLVDNYFWLREKTSKEVIAHLEAENTYTAAIMKPTEGFQEKLYQEMLGRIEQTDQTAAYRKGDWWHYSRTEKGKQYSIHCRKRGNLDAQEEIILDLNELAKDQKFLSLGAFVLSDNQELLAYSTDATGFREYTLQVKDLQTCKLLEDRIPKTNSVAWSADGKTLFYVTEDPAKRPYRLYRHVLGSAKDDLVYEEKDELYRLAIGRSHDRSYLFATSTSSTTTEVRSLSSDRPADPPRVILPRENDHRYHVEHRNGLFFIRTNKDAKNFKLVTAPVNDPQPKNWKEVIPHRADVLLEGIDLFANHCIAAERENGLTHRQVIDLRTSKSHRLQFPEPVYSVSGDVNPEFDTGVFRYRYQSLTTPESVFAYDMDKQQATLLKRTKVLGGFDPAGYISERVFATATDGTRIPISLVYKKGTQRDGKSPLLLYGYGAYGASLPIGFSPQRLSLLDRGVVYAMAHIRGGREMGEVWHDQGKLLNKRNTFTDFIAAADHLVAQKYTSHDRLAIQGGSAGGLLIAAVLNLRPDVCKAAVLNVPYVDAINTMLDASLPLTVQEYLEWGNPNVKKDYDYMKSYCPYTNLAAKDYPAMLVTTALNDSQVMYWEPAKYVAKLRSLKTDKNVLLFKTNMAAGHGGASGRYDALKETAFTYAFLLRQLGIKETAPADARPIVGLIPKATKSIKLDGKLDDWEGAFVTPVHVGHPDFANRGAEFLYLWDEQNLYIGLRCLDQKPAHVGGDGQFWNGDAVEFYLDTRRGDKLGAAAFGPGTLHMFYTPFTKTEIKPRLAVRDLPAFKDFKLQGAEVAADRTPWGWTAEFKLPWANFPEFKAKAGEIIGTECELCSSDGGPRVDRTFVYSGPAAVGSPSAFGRVQLVDKVEPEALKSCGRALLPLSLAKSSNYAWLYGTVFVSPTIDKAAAKIEGKIIDADGKMRKTSTGSKKTVDGAGFVLWTGSWELFDLPPGTYSLELSVLDKAGQVITSREEKFLHGNPPSKK